MFVQKKKELSNQEKCLQMIHEIERDNLNLICVQCGANLPEFISINNGVFICKNCAIFHLSLPKEISNVIKNDYKELTFHEIKYIYFGGNKRLIEFIENEYPKLKLLPPPQLFKTRVMQYYRKRLKNIVKGIEDNTLQKPMIQFAYQLIDDIKGNDNDLVFNNNQKLTRNNNSVDSFFNFDNKRNHFISTVNLKKNLNKKEMANYVKYKKREGNHSFEKTNCKNNIIINNNYNIKLDKKVINKIKNLNGQKEEKENYNNLINNYNNNNENNNKHLTINVDNSNYFFSNIDNIYNKRNVTKLNNYYNKNIELQNKTKDGFIKANNIVLNQNDGYLTDGGKYYESNPQILNINTKIKGDIFQPFIPRKKLSRVRVGMLYCPTESNIQISDFNKHPSAKENTIYSKPINSGGVSKKICEFEKITKIQRDSLNLDKSKGKKSGDIIVKVINSNKKINRSYEKFKNKSLDNSDNEENINDNNNYKNNYDSNIERNNINSNNILEPSSSKNINILNSVSVKDINNSISNDIKKLPKNKTVLSKFNYKNNRKKINNYNTHKKFMTLDNIVEIPLKTNDIHEMPKNQEKISIDKIEFEIVPKETEIEINKPVILIKKKLENVITEIENLSDFNKNKITIKEKDNDKNNGIIQKILTLITDEKNNNTDNGKISGKIKKTQLTSKNKSTIDLDRKKTNNNLKQKKIHYRGKIMPTIEDKNKYSTELSKENATDNEINNIIDMKKNQKIKYYTSSKRINYEEPKEKSFLYKSKKTKSLSQSRENSQSNKNEINKKSIRNKYKKLKKRNKDN